MRLVLAGALGLVLLACEATPANYPSGYPLPKGGALEADKTTLSFEKISAIALSDTLLAELAASGWKVTFDGGLDPSAGRVLSATKDGRTVIASVGAKGQGSILVVREGPRAP